MELFKIPPSPLECQGVALAVGRAIGGLLIFAQWWRITAVWLEWASKESEIYSIAPKSLAWIFRISSITYLLMLSTIFVPVTYWFSFVVFVAAFVASERFIRASRNIRYFASSKHIATDEAIARFECTKREENDVITLLDELRMIRKSAMER